MPTLERKRKTMSMGMKIMERAAFLTGVAAKKAVAAMDEAAKKIDQAYAAGVAYQSQVQKQAQCTPQQVFGQQPSPVYNQGQQTPPLEQLSTNLKNPEQADETQPNFTMPQQ